MSSIPKKERQDSVILAGAKAPQNKNTSHNYSVKTEKVVTKWHTGEKPLPCAIQPSQLVPHAVTIVVTTGSTKVELVAHHPIGQTRLGKGEWVLTPIEEVTQLLARKDNPNRQKVQEARSHLMTQLLVERQLLERRVDGSIGYRGKSSWPDRKQVLHDLHAKTGPWLGDSTLKEMETLEAAVVTGKETIAASGVLEKEYPDNYTTASGPLGERPQVAIPGLEGLGHNEVMDRLLRRIYGRDVVLGQSATRASSPPSVGLTRR